MRYGNELVKGEFAKIGMATRIIIPDEKPLQNRDLAATMPAEMAETAAERARARLLAEFERSELTQKDLATFAGWKQPKISKVMNGHTELTVNDLAALCSALGMSLVEAVRDHGLEFCAEMTSTQLRLHERIKQLPQHEIDAVITLLDMKRQTKPEPRRAAPPRKRNHNSRMSGGRS